MPNLTFEQTMALAGLLSFLGLAAVIYAVDLVQTMRHLRDLAPKQDHRELRREYQQRVK